MKKKRVAEDGLTNSQRAKLKKMLQVSEEDVAAHVTELEADPDCWAVIRSANDAAAFMHSVCLDLAVDIDVGAGATETRDVYRALVKAGFRWARRGNVEKRLTEWVEEFRRADVMLIFLKALRPVIKRRLKREYLPCQIPVIEGFVEGIADLTERFDAVLRMPRSRIVLPIYSFDMCLFGSLENWRGWGSDSVLDRLADRECRERKIHALRDT